MATRSPERRMHSDRRRRRATASDLHQRLEEKRKQIERRRAVRRASDRASDKETADRADSPATGGTAGPAVVTDNADGMK